MSSKAVDKFKYLVTASDYFSRDDYQGGLVMPGRKHYRSDGTEYTFQHVALKKLLDRMESQFEKRIPEESRTAVFEKITEGIPGRKKMPKWKEPTICANEKSETRLTIIMICESIHWVANCPDRHHICANSS
jgi:hypothetical protein